MKVYYHILKWVKKFQHLVIFKLKKKNYCHKNPIFLNDVDIEKVQYLKRFIRVIKNYKYFKKNYEYLYNDDRVKPLHIMPPKTSTYVKSYDEQIKWMCFLIEDDDLL